MHNITTEKLNLTNKQLLDLFKCVCALHRAQLLHNILHRTALIMSLLPSRKSSLLRRCVF